VKIREALDKRDGDTRMRRAEQYRRLSELASHATWRGFAMTTQQGFGELGPFVEPINLKAWLHEMVLRLGPSAVIYSNHFPNADPKLEGFVREFGAELVVGFKEPAE
jgi:hypothetical protein